MGDCREKLPCVRYCSRITLNSKVNTLVKDKNLNLPILITRTRIAQIASERQGVPEAARSSERIAVFKKPGHNSCVRLDPHSKDLFSMKDNMKQIW